MNESTAWGDLWWLGFCSPYLIGPTQARLPDTNHSGFAKPPPQTEISAPTKKWCIPFTNLISLPLLKLPFFHPSYTIRGALLFYIGPWILSRGAGETNPQLICIPPRNRFSYFYPDLYLDHILQENKNWIYTKNYLTYIKHFTHLSVLFQEMCSYRQLPIVD